MCAISVKTAIVVRDNKCTEPGPSLADLYLLRATYKCDIVLKWLYTYNKKCIVKELIVCVRL